MSYVYELWVVPIESPKHMQTVWSRVKLIRLTFRTREGDDGEENNHDTEQAFHQIRGFDDVRTHAFQVRQSCCRLMEYAVEINFK